MAVEHHTSLVQPGATSQQNWRRTLCDESADAPGVHQKRSGVLYPEKSGEVQVVRSAHRTGVNPLRGTFGLRCSKRGRNRCSSLLSPETFFRRRYRARRREVCGPHKAIEAEDASAGRDPSSVRSAYDWLDYLFEDEKRNHRCSRSSCEKISRSTGKLDS